VSRLDEQVSFIVLQLAEPTQRRRAGIAISSHQLMLLLVEEGYIEANASRLPITCCMQALGASEQDALLEDVETVVALR
jgi:hypothetical protein